MHPFIAPLIVSSTIAALAVASVIAGLGQPGPAPSAGPVPLSPAAARAETTPRAKIAPKRPRAAVRWRQSRSVGHHSNGSLNQGVQLPPSGEDFLTWDFVRESSPNRHWRRWGHDRLIRKTLRIAKGHRRMYPDAPRLVIGDISRPRGKNFGPQFGEPGHASHQVGLDVDIYYPRKDRREIQPFTAAQIDRRLSQDLVNRFVAAGASKVFVGPNTGLTGPKGVVVPLRLHDDHLHARFPTKPSGR